MQWNSASGIRTVSDSDIQKVSDSGILYDSDSGILYDSDSGILTVLFLQQYLWQHEAVYHSLSIFLIIIIAMLLPSWGVARHLSLTGAQLQKSPGHRSKTLDAF